MHVRAFVAVLAALTPACSVLLDTHETQCKTDDDCHRRGSAFAEAVCVDDIICRTADPFGCIGTVAPPAATSGNVRITMSFYDPVVPANPVVGIAVRPCAKLDVGCSNPLASAVTSDASGNAVLTLPSGFDGYLEMTSSATVPALWYFSPFPTTDGTYRVGLLSPASFQQIAQTVGTTIDPALGHTFDFAIDCRATWGAFASGVTFDVDRVTKSTRGFYLVNGLPSTTATETSASGIGGYANLPPGIVTVTATVAASGARAGSASVLIRPGVITYTAVAPGP